MRNISFAKTLEQVRSKQKTVTRRDAWAWLEEGTLLRPVEKCMGFKKGETITPIFDDGTHIRVTSVMREPLDALSECSAAPDGGLCDDCAAFSAREATLEGFPGMGGAQFVDFFCEEMGCTPDTTITRIEFEYVDGGEVTS